MSDVEHILREYVEVFSRNKDDIGYFKNAKHEIEVYIEDALFMLGRIKFLIQSKKKLKIK